MRIGLYAPPDDPYWVLMRETIHQRAEQSAIDLIYVDIPDPASLADQAQMSLVEELLALGLNALITRSLPANMVYRILESGLPIFCASESSIRHPRFVSPTTRYGAAQMISRYLVERLSGRGNVLIAGGLMSQRDDGQSRIAGIRDVLQEFPDIRPHHIPSPWTYDRAYPLFEVGMRQLTEPLDAIIALSDSLALAARDAGRAVGVVNPHTLIAGINGDPLAAIAEGSMTATVEASATDFGNQVVDLAYQAAQGQALPSHFSYKMRLVTAENVTEAMKQKLVAIANLPRRAVKNPSLKSKNSR